MTEFSRRLNEALNDKHMRYIPEASLIAGIGSDLKMLAENRRPQPGIYYWVPTVDGSWKSMVFWREFYGDEVLHIKMWDKYIVPELKREFGVNTSPLIGAYRGLPRGRVVRKEDGKMMVLHGDEFTSEIMKQKIHEEFNLSLENVEWVVVDHEKMNPEHQKLVKQVIEI